MQIILEYDEEGGFFSIDSVNFKNKILANGKTAYQIVQEEIANGDPKSWYAKYRRILKDHNLITEAELSTWRSKLAVQEKEAPQIDGT